MGRSLLVGVSAPRHHAAPSSPHQQHRRLHDGSWKANPSCDGVDAKGYSANSDLLFLTQRKQLPVLECDSGYLAIDYRRRAIVAPPAPPLDYPSARDRASTTNHCLHSSPPPWA